MNVMEEVQEVKVGSHMVVPCFVVEDAAGFIEFATRAFGAVERFRVPRPDGSIQHAELMIGDSLIELGQANDVYGAVRIPIHLYVDDADALYASAMAAGANSLGEPKDQPYGDREGDVADPWGNHWYIATRRGVSPKPAGYRTVTPGLRVSGSARLLDFLRDAFGAVVHEELLRAPDGSVIYGAVRIGDSVVEIGEARPEWPAMPVNMHLFVPDADVTYASAVAAGAESINAPVNQPYGERSGGVRDPFGNTWWIAQVLEGR